MTDILVRVADLQIGGADDMLTTVGIGSCVAIMLYDSVTRIGGLAHVLLPSPALARSADNPAKFPQTAVPRLLELMSERGARPSQTVARLAGGASMFANLAPAGTIQMGERNVVATRQVLNQHGIPLVGSAVGADHGRTVRFYLNDGRIEVSSVAHGVQVL